MLPPQSELDPSPEREPDSLTFRCGTVRRKRLDALTEQAGFDNPTLFLKKLLDRVFALTAEDDFDVRNLVLDGRPEGARSVRLQPLQPVRRTTCKAGER